MFDLEKTDFLNMKSLASIETSNPIEGFCSVDEYKVMTSHLLWDLEKGKDLSDVIHPWSTIGAKHQGMEKYTIWGVDSSKFICTRVVESQGIEAFVNDFSKSVDSIVLEGDGDGGGDEEVGQKFWQM